MDRMLLDTVHKLSKFMNFQVEKCGNNGTFYEDTKYRKSNHKVLLYVIRGKSSITSTGPVSRTEGNFLPL